MSTSNPTPNPRPFTVGREAAYAAVYNVIHEWPAEVDAPRENARVFQAVEAALDALDLPARDARIRAETLREAACRFPAYSQKSVAVRARLNEMADEFERERAGKGFHSSPQPSVVSAEGSAHPQPARHGSDDREGYMSIRCDEGRPGCVGRGCICRCHIHQPVPGPWTGPRPTLSLDTPEGDTDATH